MRELLHRPEALHRLRELGFTDPERALKELRRLERGPLARFLEPVVRYALSCPHPEGALNNLERLTAVIPPEMTKGFLKEEKNLERLLIICGSSEMLSNTMIRHPEFFEGLFIKGALFEHKDRETFERELSGLTVEAETLEDISRELRLYKKREFLRIGARDLLGLSHFDEVAGELSDLACAALQRAVDFSFSMLKDRYGRPLFTDEDKDTKEAEFVVIGLGKLGGGELNFSSDIDIMYIYSSDRGATSGIEGRAGTSIALHTFFIKLAKLVTRLISAVTEEGAVFRTDLDLRPEGRSGELANSLRSAEIYYESWGQCWERAAMIKARPVAGSMELGGKFMDMIRPFVYRRYLDFTAIEEIRAMKERIDASLLRRNPKTVDVKLGAGGIREIEFFIQALQLIHGGKDPSIRERNSIKAIERLAQGGYIEQRDAAVLKESYIFLRNLEHRIQIVEGRQTQAVPARPAELERLARMMGFKDEAQKRAGELFWEEYRKRTAGVHRLFRSLFYKSEEKRHTPEVPEEVRLLVAGGLADKDAQKKLSSLGFRDTDAALKKIALLRDGPPGARLSTRARTLLQNIAPLLLHYASLSPDPDRSLIHIERFISSVGARTVVYSLLRENPGVMEELVKLFGTSEFLSRELIEHPERLDLLLSRELSRPVKTPEEIQRELDSVLDYRGDYEENLENLRRFRNQEIFRIGFNDVTGRLGPAEVSGQITFVAEAALEASLRLAREVLRPRYGLPHVARFCIIGLGKLGAGELIYGSDLDILFLYEEAEDERETPGPGRISIHEFFVKLAQRIISILSLNTREGFVFRVDTRLRPSGSAGPLVVSRPSFTGYHRAGTSVWERQALTRARAVAGDREFGRCVLDEVAGAVYSKALDKEDIDELLRIRRRMELEIARETGTRYNIKTGRGGLVDIEFLVQALQLKYAGREPALRRPSTLEALSALKDKGFLAERDFETLVDAYGFLRLLEMRLRIVHDRPEGYIYKGSEELTTLARWLGYKGPGAGDELLKRYRATAEKVRKIYLDTLRRLY